MRNTALVSKLSTKKEKEEEKKTTSLVKFNRNKKVTISKMNDDSSKIARFWITGCLVNILCSVQPSLVIDSVDARESKAEGRSERRESFAGFSS